MWRADEPSHKAAEAIVPKGRDARAQAPDLVVGARRVLRVRTVGHVFLELARPAAGQQVDPLRRDREGQLVLDQFQRIHVDPASVSVVAG